MILLKFIGYILLFYLGALIFFRLFGKAIGRFVLSRLVNRAQADMDRQSREFQQKAEGHSPFEESVYVKDDVKVSIRRGQKEKNRRDPLDPKRIVEVDYEDLD
jgi:hypothetical protein